MRRAPALAVLACLVFGAVACARGTPSLPRTDSAEARRVDGTWHIHLGVDRLRFAEVPPEAARRREASGTIAFLPNDWVDERDGFEPSHIGSYSIDFSRIGIEPRRRGRFPQLIAAIYARDSLEIILEPEDDVECVVLRGGWAGDSIIGHWSLEPARAGGDAAGIFSLTRAGQR